MLEFREASSSPFPPRGGVEHIKNKAQKSDVGVQCVKIITDKSQVLGRDFGSVTTDLYPGIQLAHAEQS